MRVCAESVRGRREDVRDLRHLGRLKPEYPHGVCRDVGGLRKLRPGRAAQVQDGGDRGFDLRPVEPHAAQRDHRVSHLLRGEGRLPPQPLRSLGEGLESLSRGVRDRLDEPHLVVEACERPLGERERQRERPAEREHLPPERRAGSDEAALPVLLRPGTSLGGARPKASVTAPDGSLWIARFPSKEDDFDTGAWEYLVHILAADAGLRVPEAQAQKFSKTGTTFLCRRFDRDGSLRIPFASAMAMLGCEDRQEENNGTYLDIAGFLMQHGAKPDDDLPELWRRMVFSLLVSNTDDHLRNHGFIAENGRWRLSSAYDLNANAKRPQSLSLELDAGVPIESIDTLLSAAEYFRLGKAEAEANLSRIRSAVAKWHDVAVRLGIPRREQEEMAVCFKS